MNTQFQHPRGEFVRSEFAIGWNLQIYRDAEPFDTKIRDPGIEQV